MVKQTVKKAPEADAEVESWVKLGAENCENL